LADAKTLNKVKELLLRNAALAVSGVWMARNDGVINANSVRIFPGAVLPVRSTAGPEWREPCAAGRGWRLAACADRD
jgi:hypothetical protein